MSDGPDLKSIFNEIISTHPSMKIDPYDAVGQLRAALSEGDTALGAKARELWPLIMFSLWGFRKDIDRLFKTRPRGRPKKGSDLDGVDNWRAYSAWICVIKVCRQPAMSNRAAIAMVRQLDQAFKIPMIERPFGSLDAENEDSFGPSLSRGRTFWGMNEDGPDRWNSPKIEAAFESFIAE